MKPGFIKPLKKAYQRMKKDLFQPFDLNKWIYVGFTSFLAGLTGYSSGTGSSNIGMQYSEYNWDNLLSLPENTRNFLELHPVWFAIIVAGLIFIFCISLIVCWISSRGRFMFLDNILKNNYEVVRPWHEFKKEGNSLFKWLLCYGLVLTIVILMTIFYAFEIFRGFKLNTLPVSSKTAFIMGFVFTLLTLSVIFGYTIMCLNHFVIPIMYKYRIGVNKAWSKFFTLALRHAGRFILYGLFLSALQIITAISVALISIMTCCIGFLILMLPFVQSVFLLPVSYTFRALSIEFLSQFGEEYDLTIEVRS